MKKWWGIPIIDFGPLALYSGVDADCQGPAG